MPIESPVSRNAAGMAIGISDVDKNSARNSGGRNKIGSSFDSSDSDDQVPAEMRSPVIKLVSPVPAMQQMSQSQMSFKMNTDADNTEIRLPNSAANDKSDLTNPMDENMISQGFSENPAVVLHGDALLTRQS